MTISYGSNSILECHFERIKDTYDYSVYISKVFPHLRKENVTSTKVMFPKDGLIMWLKLKAGIEND